MFKKRNALKFVMLCLLFTATAIVSLGCDDSDDDSAPTRGEISIESLTPGNNALIAQGNTIKASLSYSIKDMDPDKEYVITIWIKHTTGYGSKVNVEKALTESSGVVEYEYVIDAEFDDPNYVKPFKIMFGLQGYDSNDPNHMDGDASFHAITNEITYRVE